MQRLKKILIMLIAVLVAGASMPLSAAAVVASYNVEPTAKISFTFDDGLLSALSQAAPTLAAHGLAGTSYITTGCVGMSTWPNDCEADPDVSYMTWEQIAQLRDQYGWEIGGHSATHPELATYQLTDEQLAAEITGSKQVLIDHGFDPVSFASPYGDYSNHVLAEIAKSYASHRGFWDVDPNIWPYNNYILNNMQVQVDVPVASVLARIDQAVANKEWLVLTFHGIEPTPSSDPEDYQYTTADLNTIAAYVKAKQDAGLIKAVNVRDGLVASDTNLLPNGNLANGLTDGWSTDTPATVLAESGNHGSYPEPQNAVLMKTSTNGNSHLLTPKIDVRHTKTYMIQSFLNLFARSSGELGYYIDEYNGAGDWISGQWKGAKTALTVSEQQFTYTPTSPQVAKARLQVYVTPGSGIQAYVDNFRWFVLEDVDSTPPATQNMLPNSDFAGGVAEGWMVNSTTAFSADHGGNGAPESPTSAIKLLSGEANASLFAPQVDVDITLEYNVSAFLNIQTLVSNEVAFYIDEYDENGDWISGQYKTAKRDTGIEIISFAYIASTSTVKKAGLQIILVANSGITGYLDEVRFLAPAGSSPPPDPGSNTDSGPAENLLPNGTFDEGLSGGWTTDGPLHITPDNTGQGSPQNPDNAIKLVASTQNRHLFSPLVDVDNGNSYALSDYLDIRQITNGEVGFYIDEYDNAANWISGQYIMGISIISAGDFGFTYIPTSTFVTHAALQIILPANSKIFAYLDDVYWLSH